MINNGTFFSFFALVLLAQSGIASAGTERGGGDICQDRIEQIRNDIDTWIQAGARSQPTGSPRIGSALLDFSKTSSTLANYDSEMLLKIKLTRANNQSSISCTDNPKDVLVDGVEKTCKAYGTANKPRILCYRGLSENGKPVNGFMGLSENDQYFQVHHEFAVLSGIEDQASEDSDYPLSDQIVGRSGYPGFLINQVVKKLSIVPGSERAFAALENGTYHNLRETELLGITIRQDENGAIHYLVGAGDDAGGIVVYSPGKSSIEFVRVVKSTVDQKLLSACGPTRQNPTPCGDELYDSSGELRIRLGDSCEESQTLTVLDPKDYVLGAITYTYHRDGKLILEELGEHQAPLLYKKDQ